MLPGRIFTRLTPHGWRKTQLQRDLPVIQVPFFPATRFREFSLDARSRDEFQEYEVFCLKSTAYSKVRGVLNY